MSDLFLKMFTRLIGNEGGYVNNPNDPGGETKFGISKRSYPNLDIKNLTVPQAQAIYYHDFWQPINGDSLLDGIAYQLFDFAANSGIQTSIRAYQRALGVADDGHFGPVSIEASKKQSEPDQIMLILAERLEFMTKCKNWKDAGAGWSNRVAKCLRYGAQDS